MSKTATKHVQYYYYKRISRNIYAQTREECEEKLAVLIVEMKAEIKAEKERRKQAPSA